MNLQNLSTAELTEAFARDGKDELVVLASFKEMVRDGDIEEAVYEYSAGYGHKSLLAVRDSVNGLRARKYDIISRTTVAVSALAADTANGTANAVASAPADTAVQLGMSMLDLGLDLLTRKVAAGGKMVEDLGAATLEKVSAVGEGAMEMLPDTSTVEAAGEFVANLGSGAMSAVSSVGEGALAVVEGVGSVAAGIAEGAGDILSGL